MFRVPKIRAAIVACSLVLMTAASGIAQEKLSVQEVLARHLKSFGSPDAIAKSQNRMAVGTSQFAHIDTSKRASGDMRFASNGKDMAFLSTFDMRDYRMERIGIFSDKIDIPVVQENHRSPLGSFLLSYDKFLGGRLFGGSIFSTWPFFSDNSGGLKLEMDGKKKVNNRDAWVIKVSPKGGLSGGSYIKLYFDAENFHHVRTVFHQKETETGFYDTGSRETNAGTTGNWGPGEMTNNGSTLTEDFDDFKTDAAGITLPHKYSVVLYIDSRVGSAQFKWDFNIKEYKLVNFPPNFFSFQIANPG